MNKEESIAKRIETSIEEQIEDIPKKDSRFYQVEKLARLAEVLEYNHECKECHSNLLELEDLLLDLKSVMEVKEKRIKLEKVNDASVKHLRKEHNTFLPKFYMYTYSFIGLIAGIFFGTVLVYLRDFPSKLIIIGTGAVLGLIIGRLIGSIRDRSIKRMGKQI